MTKTLGDIRRHRNKFSRDQLVGGHPRIKITERMYRRWRVLFDSLDGRVLVNGVEPNGDCVSRSVCRQHLVWDTPANVARRELVR